MEQTDQVGPSIWSPRLVGVYFWALAAGSFGAIASLAVERTRGCSIMAPYAQPGEHFTLGGCVVEEVGHLGSNMLIVAVPILAAVAALGLVVFMSAGRGVRDIASLGRWLAFALAIAFGVLLFLPNGLYFLSAVWGAAAVPASSSVLRGYRWRAAEFAAVALISVLSLFLPIVD